MRQLTNKNISPDGIVPGGKSLRGYTLEELRSQRAYLILRKEYAKARVLEDIDNVRNRRLIFGNNKDGNKKSGFLKVGTIASKVFSGMNYLDYAMIGFSVFSTMRKFFRFFRKKK